MFEVPNTQFLQHASIAVGKYVPNLVEDFTANFKQKSPYMAVPCTFDRNKPDHRQNKQSINRMGGFGYT